MFSIGTVRSFEICYELHVSFSGWEEAKDKRPDSTDLTAKRNIFYRRVNINNVAILTKQRFATPIDQAVLTSVCDRFEIADLSGNAAFRIDVEHMHYLWKNSEGSKV